MYKHGVSPKVGIVLSSLAFAATGCAASVESPKITNGDYEITAFTYNQAQHIGRVVAAETFKTSTTPEEAERSIETALNGASDAYAGAFPDVPAAAYEGRMDCRATNYLASTRTFVFNCVVTTD